MPVFQPRNWLPSSTIRSCASWRLPTSRVRRSMRLSLRKHWDWPSSKTVVSRAARLARLKVTEGGPLQASIFLKPDPRLERCQWSVAHEIGEHLAADLFDRLSLDPRDAPAQAREWVANHFASRLMLPSDWFFADAAAVAWHLPRLKRRYATASHELIARRMLDGSVSIIITIHDQGQLTWRRGNVCDRVGPPVEAERRCWRHTHETGRASRLRGQCLIECWPVHEPDWKREILRTEPHEEW